MLHSLVVPLFESSIYDTYMSTAHRDTVWVVIPTYNEEDNIVPLVQQLRRLPLPHLSILIADDNSADQTAQAVIKLQAHDSALHLIRQSNRIGFGPSYTAGFAYAVAHGASIIVQMDADLSHDPGDVPRLLQSLAQADLVIGSRYLNGVSIINWPLKRLVISLAANVLARLVTGLPFYDITGGFRAWRSTTLVGVTPERIRADGYGFLIAMLYRAWERGVRIEEVPIVFTERRSGQSKMSKRMMIESLLLIIRLRLLS